MKKHLVIMVVLFLLIGLAGSPTDASLVSTFDSSIDQKEGWTTAGSIVSGSFIWVNTGGNPPPTENNGFIRATDTATGGTWFFVSPDSWDGNWSGYIGGSLEYDIKLFTNSTNYYTGNDVRIYRGAAYAYLSTSQYPTYNTWTHYQVDLVASKFTITPSGDIDTFAEIMANVTALYIRGEYIDGNDQEGLDNARVTAIPLPAAVLLLGTGLVGLGALGVRRRRFRS